MQGCLADLQLWHPSGDTKRSHVVAVFSRQPLIDSAFSTVVCATIYTRRDGFATQVNVGPENGLKHESSILCDVLVSIPKSGLTNYLSTLPAEKLAELDEAPRVALALA